MNHFQHTHTTIHVHVIKYWQTKIKLKHMSYIHKDSIYSICIACFLCINRNKENMRNQFIHFNVSMIMLLTPFCSKQSKWFNYGKCFLWSYKSWFSVSCTFKIKNLINKQCKCSHLRITCNNRLHYCVMFNITHD